MTVLPGTTFRCILSQNKVHRTFSFSKPTDPVEFVAKNVRMFLKKRANKCFEKMCIKNL